MLLIKTKFKGLSLMEWPKRLPPKNLAVHNILVKNERFFSYNVSIWPWERDFVRFETTKPISSNFRNYWAIIRSEDGLMEVLADISPFVLFASFLSTGWYYPRFLGYISFIFFFILINVSKLFLELSSLYSSFFSNVLEKQSCPLFFVTI